MDTNFSKVEANTKHAKELAQLSAETFYNTFAPDNIKENIDNYIAEHFTEKALLNELADAQNKFLLFYNGDDSIGYVKLRFNSVPPKLICVNAVEIQRLYLEKAFHGTGIAQTMMDECIVIAKHRQASVLWLAVWEKNPRAIRFYKKFGFKEFGTTIFMMAQEVQHDIMMKLELITIKKIE